MTALLLAAEHARVSGSAAFVVFVLLAAAVAVIVYFMLRSLKRVRTQFDETLQDRDPRLHRGGEGRDGDMRQGERSERDDLG